LTHLPSIGRILVYFEDETGNVLQMNVLPALPRVGDDIELIGIPEVDVKSLPKLGPLKSIKSMIWGPSEEDFKDVVLSKNPKVYEGTVVRVKWTIQDWNASGTVPGNDLGTIPPGPNWVRVTLHLTGERTLQIEDAPND